MRTGLTTAPLDFRRFGREVWDLPIFALADLTLTVFAPFGGLTFLVFAFAGIALATLWIFDFDLDLAALALVAMFIHSPLGRFCAQEQGACSPSKTMTRLPGLLVIPLVRNMEGAGGLNCYASVLHQLSEDWN